MIKEALVDAVLRKYGLPPWMKDYIREYIKGADAGTMKMAMGFLKVGRRRGVIKGGEIILPNGKVFRKKHMLHLLNLCYYYEKRVSEISERWATTETDHAPLHEHHFLMMSNIEAQRARAIKNLISAMKAKPYAPNPEHSALFDYVGSLRDWDTRVIAKKLILYYSFAKVFGLVFYRLFYPVSPEFMRSFGKVFYKKEEVERFGEREAEMIVKERRISGEKFASLTDNILELTARAIDSEMSTAKAAGVEREVELLKNIALAYPLYRLNDLGMGMDVKNELSAVKRSARGVAVKRNG